MIALDFTGGCSGKSVLTISISVVKKINKSFSNYRI